MPVWERDDYQQSLERLKADRERKTVPIRDYPPGQAWCSACQQFKPLSRFGRSKSRSIGVATTCKPCASALSHEARLLATYNITADQYRALLESQDGKCFICRTRPRRARLAVDHDHKCCKAGGSCGKCVRGLLCKRCNRNLLGSAHDDPAVLRRAADYLERPPAQAVLGRV